MEYGKICQVVAMVECVGEFDFFSSTTCFLTVTVAGFCSG